MDLYDKLELILPTCKILSSKGPNGCKQKMNVTGKAPKTAVIGLVREIFRGNAVVESKFLLKYPEVANLCHQIAAVHFPWVEYTHIQINKNFQTLPHRDSRNIGNSAIFTVGDFEGGDLIIEGQPVNIYKNPIIFNGFDKQHWTADFTGERFSIIYFKNIAI